MRSSESTASRNHPLVAPRLRLTAARPWPAELSVEQGRDLYLAENGFTLAEYDSPRTPASLWGVKFSVPNTPKHRWAIMLHDLHHVVTGYGTDPIGEGEISAWEVRRGLGSLGLYVGSIVLGGALLGFLLSPRRILAAFLAGGRARSLFNRPELAYESLLPMSVGELRQVMAIERGGVAQHPRRLHGMAPAQEAG